MLGGKRREWPKRIETGKKREKERKEKSSQVEWKSRRLKGETKKRSNE